MSMDEPKVKRVSKSGVTRQQEYIARQKERGYVMLSSVWVPASLKDAVRAKINEMIEEFESQTNQF